MSIFLNDILHLSDSEFENWTICLNNATEAKEGIYSFSQDEKRLMQHISWKKHIGSKLSFRVINKKYCLQFIRLDKDKKYDQWLFLGAFSKGDPEYTVYPDGHEEYNLVQIDKFKQYSERLIVRYQKKQGPKSAKLSIMTLSKIEVVKVLEKRYCESPISFEGYNNLCLSFSDLQFIIDNNIDEWRIALENVNCVYVMTDTSTGLHYVGSTYGCNGIWGRWGCYIQTGGSGNNKALDKILFDNPAQAKSFQWAALEVFYNRQGNQEYILQRETYWKKALKSKDFGNNVN